MPAAPLPPNESRRLRKLERLAILDTAPEMFSEAVAAAAASIANTPMSAISLVDRDRQWFKGSCGLDVDETSREVSFCAYAILDDAPLVVPDARVDARFADNPFVIDGPNVRFYAGFPLVVDRQRVGALCVIDDRPRELSPDQVERLTVLAQGASAWLATHGGPDR